MFKRILFLVLSLCLLCGCAAPAADTPATNAPAVDTPAPEAEAYTITDDLGREVSVATCQQVAALLGSYADMWVLAGGSLCAAPEDAFEDFGLSQEGVANLGQTKKLSLESLLAAKPDLVLASTNTSQHLEWQSSLESAGIPVAYFDVTNFQDYLRVLKIFTDLTGNADAYTRYGTDLQTQIDEILQSHADTQPRQVLVLRASATYIRAKDSSISVLGQILKEFGCENIADSDETLLETLSVESILLQDPDYIFIVQSGDDLEGTQDNVEALFRENPIWQQLSAVKEDRVHFLDKRLFNLKPNARWAEAYEILEDILYEEA